MTLLVVADDETVLQKLPDSRADILISCGDIPDETILACARRCSCDAILAVRGNHDSSGSFSADIIDLHLRTEQRHGITFGGFCGAWRYKPRGNYLFEQFEVSSALREFPAVDVFVAHNSPRLVHDRDDDVHTGFEAFNGYIERAKPKYFLHGHQHVNNETLVGMTRVIGTYGYRFLVIPQAD